MMLAILFVFTSICQPRTGTCEGGVRRVPVKLVDVAGLVPGASEGKGLGNQFLGDLADADVLIHVVDISGSSTPEGDPIEPGSRNPLDDMEFLEEEISLWMLGILKKGWDRIARRVDTEKIPIADLIGEKFSGLKITKKDIEMTILDLNKDGLSQEVRQWKEGDLFRFCEKLRSISKPIVVAANKVDKPTGSDLFNKIKVERNDLVIIPTSAGVEILLQKLADKGAISYNSQKGDLKVIDSAKITEAENAILTKVENEILKKFGSTGIDEVIRTAFLDILQLITVFPVVDVTKLSDHDDRVLPDVFLMQKGSKPRDLAMEIHQDLAQNFIHAINAKTKMRLSEEYQLQDRDVIRIVSAAK